MKKDELLELREKLLKIKEAGEAEKILTHKTMYSRFKEQAEETPNKVALNYFGYKVTYKSLLEMIDAAANGYSKIGVKENDAVTLSLLASPYGIVNIYALDKLGANLHLVNGIAGIDETIREIGNFPDSKLFIANDILCSDELVDKLDQLGMDNIVLVPLDASLPKGLNLDKFKMSLISKLKGYKGKNEKVIKFNEVLNYGKNMENVKEVEFTPDHLATIAYTSGSTGKSKGVAANWEGIDSMVEVMGATEQGRFDDGDVMFTTFPLWIYYCLLNMIHEPLCLGVTLALDPIFNPKNISKRNKQYKFNHWLTMVPYIKTMLESNKHMDCSNWKIVLTGGSALDDNVKIAADDYIASNGGSAKLGQGYGATEMLGSFAYTYYDNASLGTLGVPCVGNMIKVLDVDTKKEVGPNEVGVAYLYSPARMYEYHNDPEATKHNLIVDENGVTWYNSEDLVHCNEKGEIFLDDRIRRIALTLDSASNPAKIIPARVAKAVQQNELVEKCEVITIPDEVKENIPVAVVVLNSNDYVENIVFDSIISECRNDLPEYMVPSDIMIVTEIPLTPAKKPDYKKMEEMYSDYKKSISKRTL